MKKMIVALICMLMILICCLFVLVIISQPKEKEIFTTYFPNIADKKPIEMAEAAELEANEYEEPVYEEYYEPTYYNYHDSDYDDMSPRDYIAQRESGQDYEAINGQYYGKYQLQIDMLGGDLSPENQEATAERYMEERYGSWEEAQEFWDEHGWW